MDLGPNLPRYRRYISPALRLLVSVVLLAMLSRAVEWRRILAELRAAHLGWVAAALGLFILGIGLRAWRWEGLLAAQGVRVPWSTLARWYFIGSFFNTVLPTGIGGDVVKTYALARYSERPGAALGSVFVDRFCGILSLLTIGSIALLSSPGLVSPVVARLTWTLFGGALLTLAVIGQRGIRARLRAWIPWLARTRPGQVLLDAVPAYGLRPFLRALSISLLFDLLLMGVNICLAQALGLQIALIYFPIFIPLIATSLLLPSVGGLGVREMSYVALFGQAGVSPAAATTLSLLYYAVTLAAGLLGGMLYLWPASGLNPSSIAPAGRRE